MTIMPKHKSAVCKMPLNAVTDCVVVESLRCPYCLAAVEIRQDDNWSVYWCQQHGAVEPISFTDTALADRPGNSPSAGCLPPGLPGGPSSPPGFFIESSRMHLAAMSLFRVMSLITVRSGASREGLSDG